MPTCQRCNETFTYRASEQFLHVQTGEPLPERCVLCRLLKHKHSAELHNTTREVSRATGWSQLFQPHKKKPVAPKATTPRAVPPPHPRTTPFPRLTPDATVYAQVARWMQDHDGVLPMAAAFRADGTLPSYGTINRRWRSLQNFYAAMDAEALPGCAAQYAIQLRTRRPETLHLSVPDYRRQYYARQKAKQQCITCGQPAVVEAGKTLTRCAACRDAQKQRAVRRQEKRLQEVA